MTIVEKSRFSERDLAKLTDMFGLDVIQERQFLADGLMNANWRVDTPAGAFALKRVTDVSLDRLRRNLGVLASLADDGLPVTAPVATVSGTLAAEVGGGVWCLFPWAAGTHVRGVDLALGQAADLGRHLGRLHDGLSRACRRGLLPAVPETVSVGAPTAERAVEKAERLFTAVQDKGTGSEFDAAVATALDQRRELIGKHADRRPKDTVPAGPRGWTHGDVQPIH